ncbi:hypothetical protein CS022_05620 [Veronia nyctiphanis]|uniref:Nucleotidyltransferase n=1 Tax=Veronia nyctiphanis TaxID=1278244 RepID=A0A4Q0YSA2_9GAMM|nr:hypothetical protein [Veronia nyctiphanis]RXJ74107.1 hypothetical protein CS022_05620 [Veronia nyctiphanis]
MTALYRTKSRTSQLPELDSSSPFQETFDPAVKAAVGYVSSYLGINLHSLYISGDIALRNVEGDKAVMKLTAVVDSELTTREFVGLNSVRNKYCKAYPQISQLHIECIPQSRVVDLANIFRWGFFLKHCAICLSGKNLADGFGHFEVSWEVAKAMNNSLVSQLSILRRKIAQSAKWIQQLDAAEEAADVLIRAAFGLVAHKEKVWEHSLKPCSERFLKHYPEKSLEIERLFYLIERKRVGKRAVVTLLDDLGDWIKSEYKKIDNRIG